MIQTTRLIWPHLFLVSLISLLSFAGQAQPDVRSEARLIEAFASTGQLYDNLQTEAKIKSGEIGARAEDATVSLIFDKNGRLLESSSLGRILQSVPESEAEIALKAQGIVRYTTTYQNYVMVLKSLVSEGYLPQTALVPLEKPSFRTISVELSPGEHRDVFAYDPNPIPGFSGGNKGIEVGCFFSCYSNARWYCFGWPPGFMLTGCMLGIPPYCLAFCGSH